MKRLKRLGLLAVVACAMVSMIGVANASAAKFTAAATGALSGLHTGKQVWVVSGGSIKCLEADVGGNLVATEFTDLHITVNYAKCTAFGFLEAHVTPATYSMTANGEVHILETTTITVTGGVFGQCTITIAPQSKKTVTYENGGTDLFPSFSLGSIVYTSSGSFCGQSGTLGTFNGGLQIGRTLGGFLSYDP